MKNVHIVLQMKGGVGKTFVSWLLAQYLNEKETLGLCLDLDSGNPMFSKVEGLPVETMPILFENEAGRVDQKRLDKVMERLFTTKGDTVIDTPGATAFASFVDYLEQMDVFSILKGEGVDVYLHMPVVMTNGGKSDTSAYTLAAVQLLAKKFGDVSNLFVWDNGHFSPLDSTEHFEKTTVYRDSKKRIQGIIRLSKLTDAFESALKRVRDRDLTFAEALEGGEFNVFDKSRLTRIREPIWDQLDGLLGTLSFTSKAHGE